ncbi:MAG: HEAT repeat domain-containing protein, partial [Limisphaerales bacterium]
MANRSPSELGRLLEHPDLRVRQEAQFELADRGAKGAATLAGAARQTTHRLARLHGIWGLGQLAAPYPEEGLPKPIATGMDLLVQLLSDTDAEVRAQAAKVLGDRRYSKAYAGLKTLLKDPNPRARFFAAISVGKFGRSDAVPGLFEMLRSNADADPFLRHAGVMGLVKIDDVDALLAAAHDPSRSVRLAVLLALRRLNRPEIALFLHDEDPGLVLEAARAINDEPITGATQDLAALIDSPQMSRYLSGEPMIPASVPKDVAGKLGLEALLRRVLNANFHFGTATTARALAGFAARSDAPEPLRVEALSDLGDWEHPAGIDRVIGLWRPVAAVRPAEVAAEALQMQLGDLVRHAPESVSVAALGSVGRLHMTSASALLDEALKDPKVSSEVRGKALGTIAALELPTLEASLELARKDPDEDLRRIATRLEGRLDSSKSAARLATVLETGTIGEKQAAFVALSTVPGASADELVGHWLDRLRSGELPKELRLDVVEAASKRSSRALKQKLRRYESSFPKDDPLASYEDAMYGGSAAEGKKIFFERPAAQCVRCHRIEGQGGDVGPDLSHVGAQKDRQYLLESIVMPNKQIAQGFDSVMVLLKNGDSQAGVLKSESPEKLVINTPDNGLVNIDKSNIQMRKAALSPMPEGMALT